MGALISLPLTTALALPLFSSYTTSLNLLFFAMNWYILLLSHTPVIVELYGLAFIRVLFYLIPALTFFAFDFGLPSLAESIKAHGKYALPNRLGNNKAWEVVIVAVANTALGIGLTLGLESLFENVLMTRSLLNVGKQIPLPWKAVQSVIIGMTIRGSLQYVIHRFVLHNPRFRQLYRWHAQWQHSIPAPFSLVAAYDHPVCYLLHHWVPIYLPAFVFRTHLLPFLAILAFSSIEELLAYSGYNVLPSTILYRGMARRTDVHFLAKGQGNFTPFGAVDWMAGTSAGGPEVVDDLKKEWDRHNMDQKVSDGMDEAGDLAGNVGLQLKNTISSSLGGKKRSGRKN